MSNLAISLQQPRMPMVILAVFVMIEQDLGESCQDCCLKDSFKLFVFRLLFEQLMCRGD
jgi:hypothetical protein